MKNMKKGIFAAIAVTIAFMLTGAAVSAQITITLPGIPKIKKPKQEVVKTTTAEPDSTSGNGQTSETNTATNTSADDDMDFRLKFFLEEIEKVQKSVDEYTQEDKLYLVSSAESEWLMRAISPKERAEWTKKWLTKPNEQKIFTDALDRLSASAAKKLPTYKGSLHEYKIRNAAEEKLMRGVLTRIANYKIHSSGLMQANWLIDKDDYGLPRARYKHGAFWIRDTTDDHPYCYLTYVNVIQDYAGGGTYAASYARFIRDEVIGCPAGK